VYFGSLLTIDGTLNQAQTGGAFLEIEFWLIKFLHRIQSAYVYVILAAGGGTLPRRWNYGQFAGNRAVQGTESRKKPLSHTLIHAQRPAPLVLTRARDSNASAQPPSCLRRELAIPLASLGGISPPHLLGSTRARPGPEAGAPGQAACLLLRLPRLGEEAPLVPGTLPSFPRSIRSASAEGGEQQRLADRELHCSRTLAELEILNSAWVTLSDDSEGASTMLLFMLPARRPGHTHDTRAIAAGSEQEMRSAISIGVEVLKRSNKASTLLC
jgi:hypothetical protein